MNDRTQPPRPFPPWAHWVVVTIVTAVGALWLVWTGPVPVIRITTPLEEYAPFWYMFLPFPVLGMLVAELVGMLVINGVCRRSTELACALAILVAVSHVRLAFRLPLSGHAFLLSYFIFRRVFLPHTSLRSRRAELWIAAGMYVVMCYVKLAWWTDPITLTVGSGAGGVLFWLSSIAAGTRLPPTSPRGHSGPGSA